MQNGVVNGVNGEGHVHHVSNSNGLQKPVLPPVPKRVAVLVGGWSVERDISISTAEGVVAALKSLGHDVRTIDPSPNLEKFVSQLKSCFDGGPDLVFNALHGKWGESGECQAILETMGLPFTASNSLASAVAMNKGLTRTIAKGVGVRVPEGQVMSIEEYRQRGFPICPHILKPIDSGSSFGIILVKNHADCETAAASWDHAYGGNVLVEEYIPGREISVAVFDGNAAGIVEIRFEQEIFDVTSKYVKGESEAIVPAPIPSEIYSKALKWSTAMYKALQCSGITRTDFRYNDTESEGDGDGGKTGLYFLETNTQPGLTPTSLTPKIMKDLHGWSYNDVVQWMVDHAVRPN